MALGTILYYVELNTFRSIVQTIRAFNLILLYSIRKKDILRSILVHVALGTLLLNTIGSQTKLVTITATSQTIRVIQSMHINIDICRILYTQVKWVYF